MAVSIARRPISTPKTGTLARRPVASRFGAVNVGYFATFAPGAFTFKPPKAGFYKIAAWGAGDATTPGGGGPGAASGAYVEKTIYLAPPQTVTGTVGTGTSGTVGGGTTVNLPGGAVLSAGGGVGVTPGVASGGDINLDGSPQGSPGQGTGGGAVGTGSSLAAGAPAMLPFKGGAGASTSTIAGFTPGGAAECSNSAPCGGHGQVIFLFLRD